jgi:septal ring factor EnvC (AmiA/AmiB activator)
MGLPIVPVLGAVTTLAVAVRDYLLARKAAVEKKTDAGKELAELQSDLRKQADFIAKLTEQVEALAVEVASQQKSLRRLKLFTCFAVAVAAVLIAVLFWKV